MRIVVFIFLISLLAACSAEEKTTPSKITKTSLVILGNVQDAGSPHIACKKDCCADLFKNPDPTRKVVSLGLIIPESKETYLFEATPDMPAQLKMLNELAPFEHKETPDGIFLTHAHIGHYAGLMYLGKEAMNADSLPVYVMPRMHEFLSNNGPWSQLVEQENISLTTWKFPEGMRGSKVIPKNITTKYPKLIIRPGQVPHRDEFSETVGYLIEVDTVTAIFIPDIDKWEELEKSDTHIKSIIRNIDYAFIDGTFYDGNELPGRDIREIPHPFVIESMELFKDLSDEDKAKIHFIHFNHTNPLLNKNSPEYKEVIKRGFNIANFGDVFEL